MPSVIDNFKHLLIPGFAFSYLPRRGQVILIISSTCNNELHIAVSSNSTNKKSTALPMNERCEEARAHLQYIGTGENVKVHGVYVGREYATSAEIHVGVEKLLETAFGFCGDVEVFKGRNGGLEFAEAGSEPVTLG